MLTNVVPSSWGAKVPLGARYGEEATRFAEILVRLIHFALPHPTSLERSPKKRIGPRSGSGPDGRPRPLDARGGPGRQTGGGRGRSGKAEASRCQRLEIQEERVILILRQREQPNYADDRE